jgi:hypothetical protein
MEGVIEADDAALLLALQPPLRSLPQASPRHETQKSASQILHFLPDINQSPRGGSKDTFVSPYTAMPWAQEEAYGAIVEKLGHERTGFENQELLYGQIFKNWESKLALRQGLPPPPGGAKAKLLEVSLQDSPYRTTQSTQSAQLPLSHRSKSPKKSKTPRKTKTRRARSRSPSKQQARSSSSPPRSTSVANQNSIRLKFAGGRRASDDYDKELEIFHHLFAHDGKGGERQGEETARQDAIKAASLSDRERENETLKTPQRSTSKESSRHCKCSRAR